MNAYKQLNKFCIYISFVFGWIIGVLNAQLGRFMMLHTTNVYIILKQHLNIHIIDKNELCVSDLSVHALTSQL
jgi:hypothetical protein